MSSGTPVAQNPQEGLLVNLVGESTAALELCFFNEASISNSWGEWQHLHPGSLVQETFAEHTVCTQHRCRASDAEQEMLNFSYSDSPCFYRSYVRANFNPEDTRMSCLRVTQRYRGVMESRKYHILSLGIQAQVNELLLLICKGTDPIEGLCLMGGVSSWWPQCLSYSAQQPDVRNGTDQGIHSPLRIGTLPPFIVWNISMMESKTSDWKSRLCWLVALSGKAWKHSTGVRQRPHSNLSPQCSTPFAWWVLRVWTTDHP
jgi:hypothetical protein